MIWASMAEVSRNILHTDMSLADSVANVFNQFDSLFSRVLGPDNLNDFHHGYRAEEVHADE